MSKALIIKNEITINASISKVWDLLTNPEQTKKYMFGCEAISTWKPNDLLLWKGSWEGQEMIFVKGYIISIEPYKHLTYTTFDPNNPSLEDIPGNYITVTYDLSESNGFVLLKTTQGDFATVDDGEKRYNDSNNGGQGWNPILLEIKKLAES